MSTMDGELVNVLQYKAGDGYLGTHLTKGFPYSTLPFYSQKQAE